MPQFAVVASAVILVQAAGLLYIDFREFSMDNLPSLSAATQTAKPTPVPTAPQGQSPVVEPAATATASTVEIEHVPQQQGNTPDSLVETATVSEPVAIVEPTPAPIEPVTTTKPAPTIAEPVATTEPTPLPTEANPEASAQTAAKPAQQPSATDSTESAVAKTTSSWAKLLLAHPRPPSTSTTPETMATVSAKQHDACMQKYFTTMNEAKELPLGDYPRILEQATKERDRCLGKL